MTENPKDTLSSGQKNRIFRTLLSKCLNLRATSKLLILTSPEFQEFAESLWQRALQIASSSFLIKSPGDGPFAARRSALLRGMLHSADVALIAGHKAPFSIKEAEWLQKQGVKLAWLACQDLSLLRRILHADHEKMGRVSRRLADVFSIGRKLEISHENGSHLEISIDAAHGFANDGCLSRTQTAVVIPGGMADVRPKAKTARGVLILQDTGALEGVGPVREPLKLFFREGRLYRIEGGEPAQKFRKRFAAEGIPKKDLSYVGVGTNHRARFGRNFIEDERAFGTVHLRIGVYSPSPASPFRNKTVLVALQNVTLTIDNHTVVEKGKICV